MNFPFPVLLRSFGGICFSTPWRKKGAPRFTSIRGTPIPGVHAKTRVRPIYERTLQADGLHEIWRFLRLPSLEDTVIFKYSVVCKSYFFSFHSVNGVSILPKYTPTTFILQIRHPASRPNSGPLANHFSISPRERAFTLPPTNERTMEKNLTAWMEFIRLFYQMGTVLLT